MACKPVEAAVVLLVLLVATALQEADTQGICTHQYGREPFIDAASRDCNPIGVQVRIGCGVNGQGSEIRWHRSRTADTAGRVNASAIQSNGSTRYTISVVENGFEISYLHIKNFHAIDFRYYWCSVAVGNQILPNPSEIILITRPCDPAAPQCPTDDELGLDRATQAMRCANMENNAVIPVAPDCPTPVSPANNPTTTQQPSRSTPANPPSPSTPPSPSIVFSRPRPVPSSSIPARVPLSTSTRSVPSSSIPARVPLSTSTTTTTPVTNPSLALQPPLSSDSRTKTDFMTPSPTNVFPGTTQDSVNWPLYLGITAAIVLAAIALVLVLIVCIQCKMKKLKASTYSVNPIAALSASEEERSSPTAQSTEPNPAAIELEPQKDHDYSEIAAFLDVASGARGSGDGAQTVMYETIQNTGSSNRGSSGYTQVVNTYEDVLPDPALMGRKHPYDKVEDGSPDYHRLQHENSFRSQASCQGSLKLRVSVQLSNSSNGSSLGSTDAAQVTRPHIDIYQSELDISSDEEYSHLGGSEAKPESSAAPQQQHSAPQPRGTDPSLSLSESLLPMVKTMSLIEALDTASPVQPVQGEDDSDIYSRLVDTGKGTGSLAETNQAELLQEALYSALSENPQTQVETECNNHDYHELEGPLAVSRASPGSVPLAERGTAPDATKSRKSKREGEYNHLEPKKALVKSTSLPPVTSGTVFRILSEKSNPKLSIDGDLQLPAMDSKHTYTPLIKQNSHTYTLPILSTPEKYVSEHGHVYHTLENSREN